jgi:hypothetical protein
MKKALLAAINKQHPGFIPFWPKIFNEAYLLYQKEPFNAMTLNELYTWLECGRIDWLPAILEIRDESRFLFRETKGNKRITRYLAASGTAEYQEVYDASTMSYHPVLFPLQDKNSLEIMTDWFSTVQPRVSQALVDQAGERYARAGETCLFLSELGESPFMNYIEWLAGVENGHYLLHDHAQAAEKLFEAMHNYNKEYIQLVLRNSPADMYLMVENTSTTMISPMQFHEYCAGRLGEYAEMVKQDGKIVFFHMCGTIKRLLPEINALGSAGIEAFSSPPIGDTRLIDGKTLCPDMSIIGGSNAVLWTKPTEEIIQEIAADLDCLPDHRGIIFSPGGILPPAAEPEKIKAVSQWIAGYPARF